MIFVQKSVFAVLCGFMCVVLQIQNCAVLDRFRCSRFCSVQHYL